MNFGAKQTFHIIMKYPFDGRLEWREIEGYKAVIPDFEEFEFFVHKAPSVLTVYNKWRLSEVTTGRAFSSRLDGKTRQEAIDAVSDFLASRGKDAFIKALEEVRASLPIAPKSNQ